MNILEYKIRFDKQKCEKTLKIAKIDLCDKNKDQTKFKNLTLSNQNQKDNNKNFTYTITGEKLEQTNESDKNYAILELDKNISKNKNKIETCISLTII